MAPRCKGTYTAPRISSLQSGDCLAWEHRVDTAAAQLNTCPLDHESEHTGLYAAI